MTAIGICVEWIASFIEVTLCNYFMYVMTADQHTRKKQKVLFLFVSAAITTGIILLNLVDLSFSMATLLYGIVCLLYTSGCRSLSRCGNNKRKGTIQGENRLFRLYG